MLLVIMGVVVALVMSIASRSLSDTVLSRQERESSAAFSVAEEGVESALNSLRQGAVPSGAPALSDSLGFASGSYAVAPTASYALYAREGETAQLDLTGFSGTLTLYWTKKSDVSENLSTCTEGSGTAPAAIEVSAIQTAANTVKRSYYNPASCVIAANGFTSSSDGGTDYRSSVAYVVPANTTTLRIKPIYSGATISVTGNNLKTQLYLIQSNASGGDAQKEIEVKRGLDAPPSIFDFAVFSAGTIVKE